MKIDLDHFGGPGGPKETLAAETVEGPGLAQEQWASGRQSEHASWCQPLGCPQRSPRDHSWVLGGDAVIVP